MAFSTLLMSSPSHLELILQGSRGQHYHWTAAGVARQPSSKAPAPQSSTGEQGLMAGGSGAVAPAPLKQLPTCLPAPLTSRAACPEPSPA